MLNLRARGKSGNGEKDVKGVKGHKTEEIGKSFFDTGRRKKSRQVSAKRAGMQKAKQEILRFF